MPNKSDQILILEALYAVSPSGGGSRPFTLLRKLSAEWGIPLDELTLENIIEHQRNAAGEIADEEH